MEFFFHSHFPYFTSGLNVFCSHPFSLLLSPLPLGAFCSGFKLWLWNSSTVLWGNHGNPKLAQYLASLLASLKFYLNTSHPNIKRCNFYMFQTSHKGSRDYKECYSKKYKNTFEIVKVGMSKLFIVCFETIWSQEVSFVFMSYFWDLGKFRSHRGQCSHCLCFTYLQSK